jgi:hypothetical protein
MNGERISSGLPLHPVAIPDGIAIDIPYPTQKNGSAHYLDYDVDPDALKGKSCIKFQVRVIAEPTVWIAPVNYPQSVGTLTPYFRRRGDNWGESHEAYRWYAKFASVALRPGGVYDIVAPLDGDWTAVLTSSRTNNPKAFAAAVSDVWQIGAVLGGGDGVGHGIYATGPARIELLNWSIE